MREHGQKTVTLWQRNRGFKIGCMNRYMTKSSLTGLDIFCLNKPNLLPEIPSRGLGWNENLDLLGFASTKSPKLVEEMISLCHFQKILRYKQIIDSFLRLSYAGLSLHVYRESTFKLQHISTLVVQHTATGSDCVSFLRPGHAGLSLHIGRENSDCNTFWRSASATHVNK